MVNVKKLLAELTDCDFKEMLEIKKPKSWLKSVSAFANERGGALIFGMDDDKTVVGLANITRHRHYRQADKREDNPVANC